jgi:hypothetical protein
MNFRDAVTQSVRQYYDGTLPTEAIEQSDEEFVYTLEFFDQLLAKDKKNEAATKKK